METFLPWDLGIDFSMKIFHFEKFSKNKSWEVFDETFFDKNTNIFDDFFEFFSFWKNFEKTVEKFYDIVPEKCNIFSWKLFYHQSHD